MTYTQQHHDFSKSPRSVTAFVCPSSPLPESLKLGGGNLGSKTASTRELQTLVRVVSVWKSYSLGCRNLAQRKQNAIRRRRKSVAFPKSVANIQEFDPECPVLSLTKPTLSISLDSEPEETPWYEQEYQELPWWAYPDLEEDDEITALCKQVLGSKDITHVERVEALVWKAALKFKNLAQFVLQQHQQKNEWLSIPLQEKVQHKPQPPSLKKTKASVQIPSMFVGLPKEVQAEKRRYRKHQPQTSLPMIPSKLKNELESKAPAAQAPVAPASPVRRITRRRVSTSVPIETPSTWIRSTTTVPKKYMLPKKNKVEATSAPQSDANRIQKIKQRHLAIKAEQERMERAKAERQQTAARIEAQQRRLQRLKSRSTSQS